MSSDPAVAADEVRPQVTEVALICNRILAHRVVRASTCDPQRFDERDHRS